MKRKILTYYLAGSAACLAFFVYLPALLNGFTELDDPAYILDNPYIRAFDGKFFKWAFIDFYVANWHPLTWISHALDYAVWGLNPLGHHLTSIILHAINTALVVLLSLKLLEIARTGTTRNGFTSFLTDRTTLIAAGVTGLLFGLHPVHVESVAWVSERKDLLCALFFLMSIIMYTGYAGSQDSGFGSRESESNEGADADRGRKKFFANKHYLLALGLFVLALMSKPMAVTLPVVLLILDWHPLGRVRSLKTLWAAGIEKLPFLALSLISSIVTMTAQKTGGGMKLMEIVPLSTRALVAIESLVAYLGKMLVPLKLMPFYPYPGDVSLFSFGQASAIIVMVGFTAAAVIAKKQKFWLAAWGYYVVTLIPVLGIIQVGEQSMADRYTYLPSFGPFLTVGLGIAWFSKRVKHAGRREAGFSFLTGLVTVSICIFLSYATIHQVGLWRNDIKLWGHVIENEPARVPFAYLLRGRAFEKDGQFDNAVADYTKAITLNPFFTEAYNNLGIIYGKARFYDKAIDIFSRAISFDPGRATTYSNRGRSYFHAGQYDKALEDLNKAIALDDSYAVAYVNRGDLHYRIGSYTQAAADFQKACDLGNEVGCGALRQVLQGSQSD